MKLPRSTPQKPNELKYSDAAPIDAGLFFGRWCANEEQRLTSFAGCKSCLICERKDVRVMTTDNDPYQAGPR